MFAHGGGFLPFDTGRHDNDYRNGRASRATLKGNFSSYLPRFYDDTVLFNPDMLEFLAAKVPVSHLMLASDYPFAEKRPVEYVRRAKKISRKDQDAILGAILRGFWGSRFDLSIVMAGLVLAIPTGGTVLRPSGSPDSSRRDDGSLGDDD